MPYESFSRLLPEGVEWQGLRLADFATASEFWLFPEEARVVENAVEKRRLEFASGRHCAREALSRLIGHKQAIPVGSRRAPEWPDGVVGSITHDAEICVAAVGLKSRFSGLGIDAELIERFGPQHKAEILTTEERSWIEAMGDLEQRSRLAQYFSAKEAIYKAQYPLTATWLGFHDVVVSLPEGDAGAFVGELLRPAGCLPVGYRFIGQCCLERGRSFAALALPAGL